jgi:hypothetical protein
MKFHQVRTFVKMADRLVKFGLMSALFRKPDKPDRRESQVY